MQAILLFLALLSLPPSELALSGCISELSAPGEHAHVRIDVLGSTAEWELRASAPVDVHADTDRAGDAAPGVPWVLHGDESTLWIEGAGPYRIAVCPPGAPAGIWFERALPFVGGP